MTIAQGILTAGAVGLVTFLACIFLTWAGYDPIKRVDVQDAFVVGGAVATLSGLFLGLISLFV